MEPEVQTTAPPSPHNATPSASSKNVFTIAGVSILAALIAGGGVYAYQKKQTDDLKARVAQLESSPTPAATASPTAAATATPTPSTIDTSLSYSNTAYSYSLKYPKTWKIAAKGDAVVSTFSAPAFSSDCNYDSGDLCQQFTIDTSAKADSSKTLSEQITAKLEGDGTPALSKIISTKAVTLGANDWQQVVYYSHNGSTASDTQYDYMHTYLFAVHNGVLIQADYFESQKGLSQVPSSFSFQKQEDFLKIMETLTYTK